MPRLINGFEQDEHLYIDLQQ